MAPFREELLLFLQDDKFIDWVMNPTGIYAEYWDKFLQQHPELSEPAGEATTLIKSLYQHEFAEFTPAKPIVVDALWKRIHRDTTAQTGDSARPAPSINPDASPTAVSPESSPYPAKRRRWIIPAAAASIALLVISYLYISRQSPAAPRNQTALTSTAHQDIERINHSAGYKLVYLPDGSKVTLFGNSSIKYDKLFTANTRDVYLHGEAFFEVATNAAKPFYVYSGKIITKVLGTSFRVSSNPGNGNIIVAVKTGKVSVSETGQATSLVLLPLQRCTFIQKTEKLTTDTVRKDWLASHAREERGLLNFEDAHISKVFSALEKRFGVQIIYDPKTFEDSYITMDIEEEPFEDKLKVICKTINAHYKIENYHVIIEK
jgi:transmembrane sensor